MNFKYLLLKSILYTLIISLSCVIIGATYGYFYLQDEIKAPTSINIEKGSNQKALDALNKLSIETNIVDKIVLAIIGGAKSGNISLEGAKTRLELLQAIAKGKQKNLIVTLIPGETTEVFLRNLAKKEGFDIEKLKSAYYAKTDAPEGRLYPETYSFALGSDEAKIIEELFAFSKKRFDAMQKEYGVSADEFEKKLIAASVIEKEAASKDEMPLVASVVYNRLKINMPLQMDGTLNYGIYSHQKVTPQRIREDESSYNTYKNRGLPKYPVCNPSKEAINAAFRPASTDFLYFMKSKEGRHNFSNSYTEHKSNINDVKKSNR
jgi:UPF0755 protein